ncbi:MAG: hypothetical protein GEU95_26855 [Rhizobiales bacterium]|nr:hypothetical protein [Hyphomicrobiales bacterium]
MSNEFGALEADNETPGRMDILHPGTEDVIRDHQGNAAYLEILSPDSEPARKVDLARNRAVVRKLRSGRNRDVGDEDPIEDQVEKLVAVTVGWNLIDPKTRERMDVPFSKENARKLFSNPRLGWLRRQAFTYHNNEANFMQGSSKS